MSNLLDLDKVIINDKIIKLDGNEFKVPGSFTVKEALKIQKVASEVQENPEKVEDALICMWEIISSVNPDKKAEDFIPKITINMLPELVNFMFVTENKKDKKEDGVFDNSGEESGR